jgi:quinol monooxygenase YgiN
MPLYVFVPFHATPGRETALRDALTSIVAPTRAEPGCVEMNVYQGQGEDAVFYVHSVWKSSADFDLHATLPHMREFLTAAAPLVVGEIRAVRCQRLN